MATRITYRLVPLGLTFILAACDPITLGLGLGGGYVASREVNKSKDKQERAVERRLEREDQYYQQQERTQASGQDQQIAGQLALVMLGGGLTNVMTVTPDVRGGVVTLYGTVPSPAVADRAVDAARRVPGVTMVVSRLNIMEMDIRPTGKSWQHVANVQVQQQGGQPMPMQQMPQQVPMQMMQPQPMQQMPNAVPPQALEPQMEEGQVHPRLGQFPPAFTPAFVETDDPALKKRAAAMPPSYPVQMNSAPVMMAPPPAQMQPLQQMQAPYPAPQGYQPPQFQEPPGTVPRTLPQMEQ